MVSEHQWKQKYYIPQAKDDVDEKRDSPFGHFIVARAVEGTFARLFWYLAKLY